MKILSVSDVELGLLYSPSVAQRFGDVDLLLSCGDLPYYYLEYLVSALNKPMFHVRGNHAPAVEHGPYEPRRHPWGAVDLHGRVVEHDGILLAGVEGSVRYNRGANQYTQRELWGIILRMVPALLLNRARTGRSLDIFISHAPAWGIHDEQDPAHQGARAFRWLLRTFRPAYHLHGHIHVYRSDTVTETQFGATRVINTYGYRELDVELPGQRRRPAPRQWRRDAGA